MTAIPEESWYGARLLIGSAGAGIALLAIAVAWALLARFRRPEPNWDAQEISRELLPAIALPGPMLLQSLVSLALGASYPLGYLGLVTTGATVVWLLVVTLAVICVGTALGYWIGALAISGHLAWCTASLSARRRVPGFWTGFHQPYRRWFRAFFLVGAVCVALASVASILIAHAARDQPLSLLPVPEWPVSACFALLAGSTLRQYAWVRSLPDHAREPGAP